MSSPRTFKRALITGISGSGGSYLADYIADHYPDVEIYGIARWHTNLNNNLTESGKKAVVHECDLMDLSNVTRVIRDVQPDVIFHLASHANVRACFDTPIGVTQNNILGTINLFEAVRLCEIDPIIQLCSTSEVYGQVDPKDVPITEECAMRPVSPYAVSKTAQDMLGFSYFKSFGLRVIRTRMFAYFNPRRADLFATSFARQVALIEAGKQKELRHGNLESTRTLIDVRDAMASYWKTVEYCEPGEIYNIGGNTVMTVGEFLKELKKLATTDIPSSVDPTLLRPSDVTLQIPDMTKFKEATKWEPQYSFDESVKFLLDHWRKKIKEAG